MAAVFEPPRAYGSYRWGVQAYTGLILYIPAVPVFVIMRRSGKCRNAAVLLASATCVDAQHNLYSIGDMPTYVTFRAVKVNTLMQIRFAHFLPFNAGTVMAHFHCHFWLHRVKLCC